jgi:hypothetical protein
LRRDDSLAAAGAPGSPIAVSNLVGLQRHGQRQTTQHIDNIDYNGDNDYYGDVIERRWRWRAA